MIEKFVCRFFPRIAIKKNISVGVAQIRISTAAEVLKENPFIFIKKICNDKLNIEICARLLKNIINKYEEMEKTDSYYCEEYEDIYDYIACEYLGAYAEQKD